MSRIVASLRKAVLATLAFALLAGTPAYAATFISSEGVNDVFSHRSIAFAPPASSGTATGKQPSFSETLALLPVPEPATWAMMLVGFGSIGLVVRARSRRMAKVVSA